MRIFVAPLVAGSCEVRGDEHHYLARVRRARVGDTVELVDGAGHRAPATIAAIRDDATTLSVGEVEAVVAKPPHVRAVIPAIKGDRMDHCLEKLVEVGVDAIVVWPARRAVVRIADDKRAAKREKYAAALAAAARQSGRAAVPTIAIADSLTTALPTSGACFVLDPACDDSLPAALPDEVAFVSGPEGGFAPDELAQLAHCTAIGLGPRVLRAETAPVIAVALVRDRTRS